MGGADWWAAAYRKGAPALSLRYQANYHDMISISLMGVRSELQQISSSRHCRPYMASSRSSCQVYTVNLLSSSTVLPQTHAELSDSFTFYEWNPQCFFFVQAWKFGFIIYCQIGLGIRMIDFKILALELEVLLPFWSLIRFPFLHMLLYVEMNGCICLVAHIMLFPIINVYTRGRAFNTSIEKLLAAYVNWVSTRRLTQL